MNMNFLSHLLCCFLLSVNFIILREKRCYFFSFKLNIMFTFAKKRQNFAKKNLFINFVIIKHLLNLRRDIFNYDKIKLLILSSQRREFHSLFFAQLIDAAILMVFAEFFFAKLFLRNMNEMKCVICFRRRQTTSKISLWQKVLIDKVFCIKNVYNYKLIII